MPEIHADAVAEVILLAREIGESASLGARDGVSSRGAGGLAARELRDFVDNLTEEERFSLVAIMWIGRDTFTADEYDEAYKTAAQEATTSTATYLLGVPMLADYLESGLEALGISASDAEQDLM
jgi:hypothetical protein